MQTVDSFLHEIRQILGVDTSASGPTTALPVLALPLNQGILAWLSALKGRDLQIPWSAEELLLYGDQTNLEEGQVGYSRDRTGKHFSGWSPDWLVLGVISGDPIIGNMGGEVLFARHGAGSWKANMVSPDTTTFAAALLIWCDLYVKQYSKDIYDDTYAIREDFLSDLRQRVSKQQPDIEIEVFMNMVDG